MDNLTITSGDLFEAPAQTIVNATNCDGIMGGGIARVFKERYPEMYLEYVERCRSGDHTPSMPHLWINPDPEGKNVLNLATKDRLREDSSLEVIKAGLFSLALHRGEWGITSLAMPALGCGLGKLKWEEVLPVIELYAKQIAIPIELYEPKDV